MNMNNALFDPITNSEDEMILRTGIPRQKACTYLRAYIMASLCFNRQFVISDSSLNLNRAFRTLIDYDEGADYDLEDLPIDADFSWLIQNGHISFAARDNCRGNFSDALRIFPKSMKGVDLPGEKYTDTISQICSDKYVYWYNLDEISRKFTNNFKNHLDYELYQNYNTLPEYQTVLRELIHIFSDEEIITYNKVKSVLLKKYNEKDERYQYIRSLLRKSYDYNIPDILKLDYRMSFNNIKPTRNQQWRLELKCMDEINENLIFDVYGLAKLPVSHLTYIWESSEYKNWEKKVSDFREGIIDLDEYTEVLKKYLLKISDVVRDIYHRTNIYVQTDNNSSSLKKNIATLQYVGDSNTLLVITKVLCDAWNVGRSIQGLDILTPIDIISKVLPNLIQKSVDFPEPPKEIKDVVLLQNDTDKE